MFYLTHFLKILQKSPVKGSLLVLFTLLVVVALGQKNFLQKNISGVFHAEDTGPYFHAIISGKENHMRISRQMAGLPGVQRVVTMAREEVEKKAKEALSVLQLDKKLETFSMDYSGLKIILASDTSEGTQKLIREYLVRLGGAENVTLGALIRKAESRQKAEQTMTLFKIWGTPLLLCLVSIAWFVTLRLLSKPLNEIAFVIEQYQNRRLVGFKILLTGLVAIGMVGIALAILLGGVQWSAMILLPVLLLAGTAPNLRKGTWEY